MFGRFFKMINQRWQSMHQAAVLLGVFSLVSQLIGLLRDRMLAHRIGPSATLDIYYAAFRIPDFLYVSIASLASITVLMPFLIERMNAGGKETARKFFNDVLSGFLLLLVVVSLLIFLLMPKLAHLIAPGFSPDELHKLVGVARIMLLSPIFMGLSNMLGTITQLLRKFFIFSLSPIFYNIGIIVGIIFFYPRFGVYGLAFGVIIGALMHLSVQLPTLIKAGFTPKISARLKRSSLREVAMLSLPRTLGLSLNSLAFLVIVAIGSTIAVGSISIFNFSFNLETVPVMIVGISYAVASFPVLAETFANGQKERWTSCILSSIRQIIFWSLPLSMLLIILRAQIVRVILGSGQFTWNDTRLTAAALALFSISIIAQNMILVTVRGFYSVHNTKTPLSINALCSASIVVGAFILLHIFNTVPMFRYFIESLLHVDDLPGAGILMLPLAYSLGTMLNAWLHWVDLRKKYLTTSDGLRRTLFESISASFALGLASYFLLNVLAPHFNLTTTIGVFLQGLLAGVGGMAVAMIVLYLLGSEPFFAMVSALRHKFWKANLGVVESRE